MKKYIKQWLLVILTLLLISTGAAMPWAAARFQDLYGVSSQEALPFDPVSLTLRQDWELGAALRLMSSTYDLTDWFGETRLTEEDACGAAFDALALMDQYGLLDLNYYDSDYNLEENILERMKADGASKASPVLFIDFQGTSGIIWICHWKGTHSPDYELMVDDTTGKAVIGYIPTPSPEDLETAYKQMEQWTGFFQEYYAIEITDIEDQSEDNMPRFIFHIEPEDGRGELGIILRMYDFETSFVPCAADVLGVPLPEDESLEVLPDTPKTNYKTNMQYVN